MADETAWETYRATRKTSPPDKAMRAVGTAASIVDVLGFEDRYAAEEGLKLLTTAVASDLRLDARIERETDVIKRLMAAMDDVVEGVATGDVPVNRLRGLQIALGEAEERLDALVRRAKAVVSSAKDPLIEQLEAEYTRCGPTAVAYIELLRVIMGSIKNGSLVAEEVRAYATLAAAILSKLRSMADTSVPVRVRASIEAIVRDILSVVASHLEAYPNLWKSLAEDIEATVEKHFVRM